MPPCMALTNYLSSCRETRNILIHRTLGLNLMPFAHEPISYTHMGNEADLLAGYNEDHLPMAVGCGLWLVYP
jgi:hypothetical protein